MSEVKPLSFQLSEEMLGILRDEFNPNKIVTKFSEAIGAEKDRQRVEAVGREIFGDYGRNLARRSLQLGEEYPDRTYEVLLRIIEDTNGYYRFSLLPQRFVEIAYLGTQDIYVLRIVENNRDRLIYRLDREDCSTFKILTETCGEEIANLLPCRHACLTMLETLHQELMLDAIISQEAEMPREGYCQFMARRA